MISSTLRIGVAAALFLISAADRAGAADPATATPGTSVPSAPGTTAPAADLQVSNSEALKAATEKIQPDYPVIAKQLHLEGAVEVEAHIAEDGSVESVTPLTGNPILSKAAMAATKRWKFTPFTAGGKAVKAVAPLTFSFKM